MDFENSSLEEIQNFLLLNCRVLTTIQKDKCLIQLIKYLEQKYQNQITREDCIRIFNESNECTFLTDGKKCDKKIYKNKCCKKHIKLLEKQDK